jgi:hypothetical protein
MSTLVHSDYEIRWKNYRRFEDTGWITIKPITILIGPNNSGKSSILSPLLLLDQTIKSNDAESPIVARGQLVDGGNYRDLVHRHDVNRDIFLGVRFHTHPLQKKTKPVGAYPPGAIELTLGRGHEPQGATLKKVEIFDLFRRSYISRAAKTDGTYGLRGAVSLAEMSSAERGALRRAEPVNFLFSPTNTLASLGSQDGDVQPKPERFSEAFSHYLKLIGYAQNELLDLFEHASYVGPLRQKLERFYRVSAEAPLTVGSQGEHSANLFRRERKSFQKEIDKWVKQFEFGDSLIHKPLGDDLFQLYFKTKSDETNVADAGFGASQVLPLIIQAMAAPRNSLTLAEQPEIHLNPKLQCVLADLFVYMANSHHRILVETHSEHLITRLRSLIASGAIDAEDVALYFVEKSEGVSTIREVPISDSGNIDRNDWPAGFFDDALREALGLATAQAARRTRAA